ncbi:UNVERIFIED_CONTAM: ABC transporter B family member 5 [Sesamum indicum]
MELRRAKDGVKKNQKVGLYKLLFLYADRRDVVLMIIGSIGAIANGASQPISTLAFSQLVNSLGNPSRTQLLHQVALKILFVAIGGGIAGFLQVCCWMVAGERQSSRIRALYLKSLLRQEIAFFDTKTTTGEVMSTISGDNILIHEAMGEKVGKFIEFASTFISGFIIAFARGWFLSIVLLSWVPAIAIIGGFLALLTSKISASGQVAYAEAGNVVDQALGAIRTVFFAFQISSIGIAQSSSLLTDFNKFKESAASIFEILDRKSLIDSSSRDGLMLDTLKGDIKFQHVSFKYATRPDTQIFQDLSLSISSGKTTALVGQSGSGKSTVINLLQRFYDPDSGNIYLDEIEIRQFNLSWLRRQMGLVSQEPILFNETIRDNITYGSQGDVMEEEIIVAAKAAHAHNFISSLPDGYDTYVGERGIHLSGGQKQRIAIARVILKDPKILLLDEATSALDAESERLVMDALDGVRINRTTVIVAHRLSTVRDADTIAVVKDGVVAEKGTHEVLMGIGGSIYANLVMLNTSST